MHFTALNVKDDWNTAGEAMYCVVTFGVTSSDHDITTMVLHIFYCFQSTRFPLATGANSASLETDRNLQGIRGYSHCGNIRINILHSRLLITLNLCNIKSGTCLEIVVWRSWFLFFSVNIFSPVKCSSVK